MRRKLRLLALILWAAGTPLLASDYRSMDGSGNNQAHPTWGQADQPLLRMAAPGYEDGLSMPRGGDPSWMPSARMVSNAIAAQPGSFVNARGATSWLFQWGQFLDHDIDLTDVAQPYESFNIDVPADDPYFAADITLNRSVYTMDGDNCRQQMNQITAFIDGSVIYGSDAARAAWLRTNTDGKLKTSAGNLLPLNADGLPNASMGPNPEAFFVSGDVRANEQIGLTATHTLFMREHNRLVDQLTLRLGSDAELAAKRDAAIADAGNGIDDDDDFLYYAARAVVGAEMQKVTYEEFLPVLLGATALAPYAGYRADVNPGICNEFSTAAYRFGHTTLPEQLLRVDADGSPAPEGAIELRDAFFNPQQIKDHGIESLLNGLSVGMVQEVDTMVVDAVRNFLFSPPGNVGFDLASLNIQRGRDHGVPGLNDMRDALGLPIYLSFDELTGGDLELADKFRAVYGSAAGQDNVDDVDLWIGGLGEPHYMDSMLGETFTTIIADQFQRLRDGDRFFYLTPEMAELLGCLDPTFADTRLADIIARNTGGQMLRADVFLIPEPASLALLSLAGLAGIRRRR